MDPYRNPYDQPWINEMDDGTHRGRAGGTRGEYRKAPEDISAGLAKERPEAIERPTATSDFDYFEDFSPEWYRIYGD